MQFTHEPADSLTNGSWCDEMDLILCLKNSLYPVLQHKILSTRRNIEHIVASPGAKGNNDEDEKQSCDSHTAPHLVKSTIAYIIAQFSSLFN